MPPSPLERFLQNRDEFVVSMVLPVPPGNAPASTGPQDAGAPFQCVWLFDCKKPAVRAGLCAFHAHVAREEIAEYERGDLKDDE